MPAHTGDDYAKPWHPNPSFDSTAFSMPKWGEQCVGFVCYWPGAAVRLTYVRFVVAALDPDSGRRQGLFQVVGDLVRTQTLSDYELAEINALQEWFCRELDAPDRFSTSRRSRAAPRAISWFKSTATEHVRRMHALCRLLGEHGIATEMLRSERPGYVVFEDAY